MVRAKPEHLLMKRQICWNIYWCFASSPCVTWNLSSCCGIPTQSCLQIQGSRAVVQSF